MVLNSVINKFNKRENSCLCILKLLNYLQFWAKADYILLIYKMKLGVKIGNFFIPDFHFLHNKQNGYTNHRSKETPY